MKKIIFTIISISLFLFFIILFDSLKINRVYNTEELVGKPIPSINLEYLNEDKYFNTSDLSKNQFTLINFFSSWCGPCRKEHKYLISLSEKNLKIVGINFKDKKQNANQFLNDLGNPYYLTLKDNTGKKSVDFGVYGIPETILINKNLLIIKKYIGPIDKKDMNEILRSSGIK